MTQGQLPCRCPSQILQQVGCQCEASGHCRITPQDAERLTDDYSRRMLADETKTYDPGLAAAKHLQAVYDAARAYRHACRIRAETGKHALACQEACEELFALLGESEP